MSRFNTPNKTKTATTNLAGGKAYAESAKLELASLLLTSFVDDKAYRTQGQTVDALDRAIAGVDPLFAAKAAVYARKKHGIRTITHLTASKLAPRISGQKWAKEFYKAVINRPDDMLEILAYYKQTQGKSIPNAMKKGFASAISELDAYTLAKYRGDGKDLKMVDLVNLIHPKPSEKSMAALDALMKGELKSTETWESKLTQAGQQAESEEDKAELKGKAWKDLIAERKIGYFALLRNLRNIIEQAPDQIDAACALLTDEKLIQKSLVLPFRYSTALTEMEKLSSAEARKAIVALNKAVDLACKNVPQFDGKTLVVLDVSGSMSGKPAEIGSLFSAVILKSNPNADFMVFSDDAQYKQFNPNDSVLTIARSLRFAAGGTNFQAIMRRARAGYDRMIILSDMQGWIGGGAPTQELAAYRTASGKNTKIYSFDLAGYGTLQFPEKDVYALAGFSEKTLDIMKMLEVDRNALVKEIEATSF